MRWVAFIPMLWKKLKSEGPPDLLVIQIGENDLVSQKSLDLALSIKAGIELIHDCYPRIHIMWSDLLERRCWLGARNPKRVNVARQKVSKAVGRAVVG
ncbi:hypothetical protein JRQ81_015799, partial [Phrynocephalus forsythii]